jgi:hypothetical protein
LLSHTQVVCRYVEARFNFFVTKGYEQHSGTRTDIWFLNQLKSPGKGAWRGTTVGLCTLNQVDP